MRYTLFLAAALVAAGAVADATTPRLPESFSYTIYINGERAGRSESHVTYAEDAISIESKTWVELGQGTLEVTCHTEADPRTFRVRRMSVRGGNPTAILECTAEVSGDTVFTTQVVGDRETHRAQRAPEGVAIVIEDYDMTHQVLLARALAQSDAPTQQFGLAFASTGALLASRAGFVSEASVESATQEAICRRLVVEVTSGAPFMSYYDPERGMPVYVAFPTVFTEAFLDGFYGDEPVSRIHPQE